MKTSFIKNFIKGVKIGFDKHSPEILIGLGIASAITSTVLAVKATPKALLLIKEEEKIKAREYNAKHNELDIAAESLSLSKPEMIKVTWKCYIPAAISGAASIAFLLGSNSVHARRNAAIATAYKLSETALTDYKKEVIETIGEEKAKLIQDKVVEKLKNAPSNICRIETKCFLVKGYNTQRLLKKSRIYKRKLLNLKRLITMQKLKGQSLKLRAPALQAKGSLKHIR